MDDKAFQNFIWFLLLLSAQKLMKSTKQLYKIKEKVK